MAAQRAARAVIGRFNAREEARAGAALLLIHEDSKARERRGERLREDGFFDDRGALRPEAEELLEGVLRQASETYEERKLPLLSRLYSAIAHDATVPAADGLYLLRLAGQLTYRQFVALGAFERVEEHREALSRGQVAREEGDASSDPSVVLELDDLGGRLVGALFDDRVVEVGSAVGTLGAVSAQRYETLRLTMAGEALACLSGAGDIAAWEHEAWVRAFTEGMSG